MAEKLHAMVVLGLANSRMKDYFDLHALPMPADDGLGLDDVQLSSPAGPQTAQDVPGARVLLTISGQPVIRI